MRYVGLPRQTQITALDSNVAVLYLIPSSLPEKEACCEALLPVSPTPPPIQVGSHRFGTQTDEPRGGIIRMLLVSSVDGPPTSPVTWEAHRDSPWPRPVLAIPHQPRHRTWRTHLPMFVCFVGAEGGGVPSSEGVGREDDRVSHLGFPTVRDLRQSTHQLEDGAWPFSRGRGSKMKFCCLKYLKATFSIWSIFRIIFWGKVKLTDAASHPRRVNTNDCLAL